MTPKNKRSIYLILFTVVGLLIGVLAESLMELAYIGLLVSDFNRYSYGLSWEDLKQFRDIFAIILLAACGVWGYNAGNYWWHQIYELKKFSRWHWFKK